MALRKKRNRYRSKNPRTLLNTEPQQNAYRWVEIGEDYDAFSKQGESVGSLQTAASVFTFCGQNVQTHWKSPICDIHLHLLKAVEKFQLQPIRRNHGLAHIGIFKGNRSCAGYQFMLAFLEMSWQIKWLISFSHTDLMLQIRETPWSRETSGDAHLINNMFLVFG